MSTDSKLTKVIAKLTELTQTDQLRWTKERETEKVTEGTDNVVQCVYTADHAGKKLRIYEMRYREEELYQSSRWDSDIVLELVDLHGNREFRFPTETATANLFRAVCRQSSGVEDFISQILGQ